MLLKKQELRKDLSYFFLKLYFFFLGSFDIVHVKDAKDHQFATRMTNVFVIGKGSKEWVSLPRGKGVRLTIAEERDRRLAEKVKH